MRCPYCDPYPVDQRHLYERVANYVDLYLGVLPRGLLGLVAKSPRLEAGLRQRVFVGLIRLLRLVRLARFVEVTPEVEKHIYNRSLVIIKEARRRGYEVLSLKIFSSLHAHFFSLRAPKDGKELCFEGLPARPFFKKISPNIDDKLEFKNLLASHGLPNAPAMAVTGASQAIKAARSLGWPVVVKPRAGSLSRHTFVNIKGEQKLLHAFRAAKKISSEVLVERFIPGRVFRVTLINNKLAGIAWREPPNVVGDGRRTIRELIEIKNADPRRGPPTQKNTTLHQLRVTAKTKSMLRKEGLGLDDVLPAGRKLYLHDKIILAIGADIHELTERVHPDNEELFKKTAAVCRLPLLGLDFICQDVARTWHKQFCGFIEANSLPFVDMHMFPSHGQPRNIAAQIINELVEKPNDDRSFKKR